MYCIKAFRLEALFYLGGNDENRSIITALIRGRHNVNGT